MKDYKETILESTVVLYDGVTPEIKRRVLCTYDVVETEWVDDYYDDYVTWVGTVEVACYGCAEMLRYGDTLGDSLDDLELKVQAMLYRVDRDRCFQQARRLYCSDKCRKRIERGYIKDRADRPCKQCGSILKSKNPKTQTCSAKCRVAYSRANQMGSR